MSSFFSSLVSAPPDPIFLVTSSYHADKNPQKMNLGVGAYRTEEGKPWILPVVTKAESMILADKTLDHEYLPIDGLKEFTAAASRLVLGAEDAAFEQERVVNCQAISGTGALTLGASLFSRFFSGLPVYISNPTWGNHRAIFESAGLKVETYRYYNPQTNGLDLDGMLSDLTSAPTGSIIVLHACAHNPTGVDPTESEWEKILRVMQSKSHFPFFDVAYQGFASGDFDRDAISIRMFSKAGLELFVAQSFSKNLGLYNERVGNLTMVTRNKASADILLSQMKIIVRKMYSNPPCFGARIASLVMNRPEMNQEWKENVKTMSYRIQKMRKLLFDHLKRLKTPGNWQHILNQIGMFTFTGLNPTQVEKLTKKFHVYLLQNGRINMCGITEKNVAYLAESIHAVVTDQTIS